MPGMAVRVSAKGKRSSTPCGAAQGRRSRPGCCSAPTRMTLAEARAKAREALGALMDGQDPATLAAAKRRRRTRQSGSGEANTFGAVAEDFIRRHADDERAGDDGRRHHPARADPGLGEQPIAEIRRAT